jgi:hypothetical protein
LDQNIGIFNNIINSDKKPEAKEVEIKRKRNRIQTYNSESSISENKNDDKVDKKTIRLIKNRESARKCRQKKKHYINGLEKQIAVLKEEVDKYKQIHKSEKNIENMISHVIINYPA